MNGTPPKPEKPKGPRAHGVGAKAMAYLANNGPTEPADLQSVMMGYMSSQFDAQTQRTMASKALCKLREQGMIKTRILLTPEGLVHLRRMGMAPEFIGVLPAEEFVPDDAVIEDTAP